MSTAVASDTPVKPSASVHLQTMAPGRKKVFDAVEKDLKGHTHAADVHNFLDVFFPVPEEDIEAIFRIVSQPGVNGGYHRKRWGDLPKLKEAKESSYYKPVADTANAICEAAASFRSKSGSDKTGEGDDMEGVDGSEGAAGNSKEVRDRSDAKTDPGTSDFEVACDAPIDGVWLDRHSTAPQAKNSETAAIGPDIIFVSVPQVVKQVDEVLAPVRRSGRKKATKKEQGDVETKNKFASKDTHTLLTVWWQQIHTPFEIKRKGQDPRDALLQLFSYMRSILQEQIDRRFALGLLLCFDQLTVCMCDRSGATFTKHSFSIHECFIRVIAGFSMLKPHQLGWDPDMKSLSNNLYRTHWRIDLTPRNGPPEQVLTVRGVFLARAEVMCGRATVVWEAVKFSEFRNPQNLYILKRYWRPAELLIDQTASASSVPPSATPQQTGGVTKVELAPERLVPEGKFYGLLGVEAERLASSGDVIIDGAVDSTVDFIRNGLVLTPASWEDFDVDTASPQQATGSKRKRLLDETDDNAESSLACNTTSMGPPRTLSVKIIPRNHTQLLMQDAGPCVKHFSCLKELVSVIGDCIGDHKEFNKKGVLHRDVSPGNLVIILKDRDVLDWWMTKGRLIDFDNSKHTLFMKFTTLLSTPIEESLVTLTAGFMDGNLSKRVGEDVVEAGLKALGVENRSDVVKYIKLAVSVRERYFGLEPHANGNKYSCADLGWDKQDREIPNFDDRQARLGFRSGTRPYMSYEVLDRQVHHTYFNLPLEFFHDSVHDMDSFDWVLIHICLTRRGPGIGMHREELLIPNYVEGRDPNTDKLRQCINRFFDADEATILRERASLLANPKLMDNDILPYFHPYFNPLKPLILRWWHTLVLAYRYRAFEYYHIHDFFLEALQLTLHEYKDDPSFNGTDGNEDTEREIQRRNERYNPTRIVFGGRPGVQSQNPITVPHIQDVQSATAQSVLDSTTPATRSSRKKPRV